MTDRATSWIEVSDERSSIRLEFSSRDWKVLSSEYVPPGHAWSLQAGFGGAPGPIAGDVRKVGQRVTSRRLPFLQASKALLSFLIEHEELLSFDYAVTIPAGLYAGRPEHRMWGGGCSGLVLGGQRYALWLDPGQCYLQEDSPDAWKKVLAVRQRQVPVEEGPRIIDLRRLAVYDDGAGVRLKIGRRKKGLSWVTQLPRLIEWLESGTSDELSILNAHR